MKVEALPLFRWAHLFPLISTVSFFFSPALFFCGFPTARPSQPPGERGLVSYDGCTILAGDGGKRRGHGGGTAVLLSVVDLFSDFGFAFFVVQCRARFFCHGQADGRYTTLGFVRTSFYVLQRVYVVLLRRADADVRTIKKER